MKRKLSFNGNERSSIFPRAPGTGYRRALKLNPSEPTAAANLAIYEFQNGQVAAALARWQDVFARYPGLPGPGLNLALAQSQRGDVAAARTTLLRLLRFHPGNAQARELLSRLAP